MARVEPVTTMVVDSTFVKAPELPKETVPPAPGLKGNVLDIPESSDQGAKKKIRANRIAIAVALKGIQFMNVLLCFAASFVMEIIQLRCAQIVKKQMPMLFFVDMPWRALVSILFQWLITQKLMLMKQKLWYVFWKVLLLLSNWQ